jgi:hypothetical protein
VKAFPASSGDPEKETQMYPGKQHDLTTPPVNANGESCSDSNVSAAMPILPFSQRATTRVMNLVQENAVRQLPVFAEPPQLVLEVGNIVAKNLLLPTFPFADSRVSQLSVPHPTICGLGGEPKRHRAELLHVGDCDEGVG